MVTPAGLMVMVTGAVVVPGGLLESITTTVTVVVPGVVGVPLTTQPAPSVRPAGSVPALIVHTYGPVPPVTGMVPLYGVPAVPGGSVPAVMVGVVGLIV